MFISEVLRGGLCMSTSDRAGLAAHFSVSVTAGSYIIIQEWCLSFKSNSQKENLFCMMMGFLEQS